MEANQGIDAVEHEIERDRVATPRSPHWDVYMYHGSVQGCEVSSWHGRYFTLEEAIMECIFITAKDFLNKFEDYGRHRHLPWLTPSPSEELVSQILAGHPEWPVEAMVGDPPDSGYNSFFRADVYLDMLAEGSTDLPIGLDKWTAANKKRSANMPSQPLDAKRAYNYDRKCW